MTEPALLIQQLHKEYKGREALRGVDLRIDAGQFFGLLGRNGAGKSTLIGLICSLRRMQRGRIDVFGHDVRRQSVAARRCIGLLPQEANFNSFEPLIEIVASQAMYYGLSKRSAEQRATEVLDMLGLAERQHNKAWGLSGGMKRKLMLARALVHKPKLLILDEPSAGLDVEARLAMWEMLRTLNRPGTTILLTSHNVDEVETLCDDTAIIDDGKIIARSPPHTLLAGLDSRQLTLHLAAPIAAPPVLSAAALHDWQPLRLQLQWPHQCDLAPLFAELAAQGVQVVSVHDDGKRLEARFLQLLAAGGEV